MIYSVPTIMGVGTGAWEFTNILSGVPLSTAIGGGFSPCWCPALRLHAEGTCTIGANVPVQGVDVALIVRNRATGTFTYLTDPQGIVRTHFSFAPSATVSTINDYPQPTDVLHSTYWWLPVTVGIDITSTYDELDPFITGNAPNLYLGSEDTCDVIAGVKCVPGLMGASISGFQIEINTQQYGAFIPHPVQDLSGFAVDDATSNPIVGAVVSGTWGPATTTTDGSGDYSLPGVLAPNESIYTTDDYMVNFAAGGYAPLSRALHVHPYSGVKLESLTLPSDHQDFSGPPLGGQSVGVRMTGAVVTPPVSGMSVLGTKLLWRLR